MAVIKEFNCVAHGPFESTVHKCPYGCARALVRREFRTAPAIRRPSAMKWVDNQLREIAAEHGLTDMRNDGKAGESVMAKELRRRQLAAAKTAGASVQDPRKVGGWVDIPHAPAGFSRTGEKSPIINGEAAFGTRHASGFQPGPDTVPAPRPMYVARSRDTT